MNCMQKSMNDGRDNSTVTLIFEKHSDVSLVLFSF